MPHTTHRALDITVDSLRNRVQRLQCEVEVASHIRNHTSPSREMTPQLAHRAPVNIAAMREAQVEVLSAAAQEMKQERQRGVSAAKSVLAETRRDTALAQKYEHMMLVCQRKINEQERLSLAQNRKEALHSEKSKATQARREREAARSLSARARREHTQAERERHEAKKRCEIKELEAESRLLADKLRQLSPREANRSL